MATHPSDADISRSEGERPLLSNSPRFITVELTGEFDLSEFSCSRDPDAVSYLQTGMWDHINKNCGSAFALRSKRADRYIDGYYHLVGSSLHRTNIQNSDQKKIPKEGPLPVFHIAYVARDDRSPKGIGAALVTDAARRAQSLYRTWGLTLHANNASLVRFYSDLGFKVMRSLKQEFQSTCGLQTPGPYLMYAPYDALIIAPRGTAASTQPTHG